MNILIYLDLRQTAFKPPFLGKNLRQTAIYGHIYWN